MDPEAACAIHKLTTFCHSDGEEGVLQIQTELDPATTCGKRQDMIIKLTVIKASAGNI